MEVFDREGALKAFGRPSILEASIQVYRDELPAMKDRLRTALSAPDEERQEAAHWVKGAVAYLHAPASRAAAERLEVLCKARAPMSEQEAATEALCEELDRLGAALS